VVAGRVGDNNRGAIMVSFVSNENENEVNG